MLEIFFNTKKCGLVDTYNIPYIYIWLKLEMNFNFYSTEIRDMLILFIKEEYDIININFL